MADRIHWHWMKSHTARKGPLHCTHNWCDEACGRAREKERPQQRRFIEGDWEFVLCYKEGQRVEGDPRTQVRERTTQVMWEEAHRSEGTIASALRQIQLMESEQMVKKGLQMSNDTWRIKEEARALAGVWGFGHEQHQAQGCRLCSDTCVCSQAHLSRAHEGKTMLVVNKGGGQAELYVENQSVGVVSLEGLLQEGSAEEMSGWYCNTYQHYCLNQVDPKAGGQVHATRLGYDAGGGGGTT